MPSKSELSVSELQKRLPHNVTLQISGAEHLTKFNWGYPYATFCYECDCHTSTNGYIDEYQTFEEALEGLKDHKTPHIITLKYCPAREETDTQMEKMRSSLD